MVYYKLEILKRTNIEHILLVPPENSPAPFVNFIRENVDFVRENSKIMLWVVNLDQKTISPFLGTPQDDEIWNNLTDPEKSLQAAEIWSKGAVRSRVLDENF